MRAFRFIHVDHERDVVTITFLQHLLKLELLDELARALKEASERIVITGTDGYFAAGADIGELNNLTGAEALAYARRGQTLFNTLTAFGDRSIAAIDGFCLGGGLDLALACDFRYATNRSRFAHPGGKIGILTGWGGTRRLPQTIGKPRALELMVVGRWLEASEALEWGLIDSIVEDPVGCAKNRST